MNGRLILLPLLAAVAAGWLAAPAGAELTIEPGGVTLELLDESGQPETRAGAHPDLLVQNFELTDTGGTPEHLKQAVIELPPGLAGDPGAVPLCPRALINGPSGNCPTDSQVGESQTVEAYPVWSIAPAANEGAAFAVYGPLRPEIFSGRLRPADLGLSLSLDDVLVPFLGDPVTAGSIELWGIPADRQSGTTNARKALLTMPTRCDIPPLSATVRVRTWEQPERWKSATGDTGHRLTGCENLEFDPSLQFALAEPRTDTPSGARVEIQVPQNEDPDGLAVSHVRDVTIQMPAGLTLAPGGAAGLGACRDEWFGKGDGRDVTCPASSRIGSVEIDVTGLERPAIGAVYLGEERPGDRFRLLIAAQTAGTTMKFTGSLKADPRSGRLTTALADLPEAAFDRMALRFDGGPDALLATPLACGPAPTSARFVPYSGGAPVEWNGAVPVSAPGGGACGPPPFEPTFTGGSTVAGAGRPTSFTTTVRRRDGEQLPRSLAIELPPGLSAAVGAVERCAATQAEAGACPAASRVGRALAELGPGDDPARLGGDVYLTGPYRGSPFGVAVVLEADVGPFGLGAMVVRGALRVSPLTGRVTVEMHALPTIFEGVPVRFQTIGMDLDRPGFLRNPTSCAQAEAVATLRSEAGDVATPSSPFRVRGCVGLPFRPALSVALRGGAEQLREGGRPSLAISMRVPAGGANLRAVEVRMPRLLKFSASGPPALCPRRRALAGECPPSARIGTTTARSPLLRGTMEGSLYAVQPEGFGPPDLWAMLSGQGLEVSLRGETGVDDGRALTRFAGLPDFPLSRLRLRLAGGEDGIMRLRRDPCGRLAAPTEIAGQNGMRRALRAPVAVGAARCGGDG